MEKFLAMARDAGSAGDRVLAENYFQHADHYYRVLNARFEQQGGQPNNQQNGQRPYQGENQGDNRDNDRQNFDRQGYSQDRYEGGNQGSYNQPDMSVQPHNQSQPHGQPQQSHAQPHQQPHQQPQPQQHQPQQHMHSQSAPALQVHVTPPPPSSPPSRAAEPEIGLPPGILGLAPDVASPQVVGEADDGARQQGRRRRGPRPAVDAGE